MYVELSFVTPSWFAITDGISNMESPNHYLCAQPIMNNNICTELHSRP